MSKHKPTRTLLTITIAIILMPMAPGFVVSAREIGDVAQAPNAASLAPHNSALRSESADAASAAASIGLVKDALSARAASAAGTPLADIVAGQQRDLALAQDLLNADRDASLDPMTRSLHVAELALSARAAETQDAPTLSKLARSSSDLQLSRDIMALDSAPGPDAFARAVSIAKTSTLAHAETLGGHLAPRSQVSARESPSHAAFALLSAEGVAPTPQQSAKVRSLDGLPEPARGALARFLLAFIEYDATARVAQRHSDVAGLRSLEALEAGSLSEADIATWADARSSSQEFVDLPAPSHLAATLHWTADLAPVLLARNALLDATLGLRDALRSSPVRATLGVIDIPPVMSIDLGTTSDTYTTDYLLLVDAGGDDVYLNNAGGNNIEDVCDVTAAHAAAALVDLAGNDQYASGRSCGANGGGWFGGSGLLVDAAGDDSYAAGDQGVNGGGYFGGIGMLVDGAGNDAYSAGSGGANGGAMIGVGSLVDGAGSDSYYSVGEGTNGGASVGWIGLPDPVDFVALPPALGLLVDAGDGDDSYVAGATGVNGGAQGWYTNGMVVANVEGFLLDAGGNDQYRAFFIAANGGGTVNGVGFLLDASGSDLYYVRIGFFSNGGAYYGGIGMLVDGSGDDTYTAVRGRAVNGGAIGGMYCIPAGACAPQPTMGFLVDGDGADHYNGWNYAVNGGAWRDGFGFLFDGGNGNDAYTAQALYTNGAGGFNGRGFLVDAAGDDQYTTMSSVFSAFAGNGGAFYSGRGFLLDAAGDDVYTAKDTGANGGGAIGGAGLLADLGGNDVYVATGNGVNGGATTGGSGLLVDAAGDDAYTGTTGGVNGGTTINDRWVEVCDPIVTGTCVDDQIQDGSASIGLLLDGGGSDVSDDRDGGAGADHTILSKGVGGAQVDLPVRDGELRVPPTPPDAPGNIVAQSGPNARGITVSWDSPTQNGGLAVREFAIYRDGAPLTTVGDVRSYADAGLTEDRTYAYEVRGINALGEGSSAATSATARFCGTPVDSFGYTCQQTPFVWLDMTDATPVLIGSWSATMAIPLPFELTWYGEPKADAYIASSGHVCFSEDGCGEAYSHTNAYGDAYFAFPSTQPANDLVACYWTLLDPEAGGTISFATRGDAPDRVFVVEYAGVTQPGSSGSATLQIQIHENGVADCMLNNVDVEPGVPVAVGTENSDGSVGARYTYGPLSTTELGIRFAPPA